MKRINTITKNLLNDTYWLRVTGSSYRAIDNNFNKAKTLLDKYYPDNYTIIDAVKSVISNHIIFKINR